MESLYGVFRPHKTNLDWASAGDEYVEFILKLTYSLI